MGDMRDEFDAYRDIKKTRAQARLDDFKARKLVVIGNIREVVEDTGAIMDHFIDASGTLVIKIRGRRWWASKGPTIQYYPSKGTWQVQGRMLHGGLDSFESWTKRTLRSLL